MKFCCLNSLKKKINKIIILHRFPLSCTDKFVINVSIVHKEFLSPRRILKETPHSLIPASFKYDSQNTLISYSVFPVPAGRSSPSLGESCAVGSPSVGTRCLGSAGCPVPQQPPAKVLPCLTLYKFLKPRRTEFVILQS